MKKGIKFLKWCVQLLHLPQRHKMIELNDYDIRWILLCKGHLTEEYPFRGYWHETLKPLFLFIYGWGPDENNNHYHEYLNVMFNKLLELHLKIQDDQSGSNIQLKSIFSATFYKGICNDSDIPIERAIHTLCGLIQNNRVITEVGIKRYELNK